MISEDTKTLFAELQSPPDGADGNWYRQRGFKFEKILQIVLEQDKLEPRAGYKPDGEQIDGSFFLDGKVFLLEAKWHKDPLPASKLYEFKGKVDGKLIGTIGVFISMGGYSEDAVNALTLGKSLNLILFDGSDIDLIINNGLSFKESLKLKLRMAAEEGIVFQPLEIHKISKHQASERKTLELRDGLTTNPEKYRNPYQGGIDLFIICEGHTDSLILSGLAQRILAQLDMDKVFNIVVANGKNNLPKLASAIATLNNDQANILVVADSDSDLNGTNAFLNKEISSKNWRSVVPDPDIEVWIDSDSKSWRKQNMRKREIEIQKWVSEVDIQELRSLHPSFSEFYDIVAGA